MSGRTIANMRSAAGMPTGLLAIWWLIASEIVIFGGLLASYIKHRLAHPRVITFIGYQRACKFQPFSKARPISRRVHE